MSKGIGRIAKRYAKALIELYPPAQLDEVSIALTSLGQLWEQQHELRATLKNPAFGLGERGAVLRAVVSKLRPNDQVFSNFCEVLVQRSRLDGLPMIARYFSEMVLEIKQMLSVRVTSAFPPQSGEVEALQERLRQEFGSMASVQWERDDEVIGGMRVKIGDRMLDGSVRGALDRLASQLLPG